MSTLAIWSCVVHSRDVSPHNFDGLAMSVLANSVAPNSIPFFKYYSRIGVRVRVSLEISHYSCRYMYCPLANDAKVSE